MEQKALLTKQFCLVFKILVCLPTSNLLKEIKPLLRTLSTSHFDVIDPKGTSQKFEVLF